MKLTAPPANSAGRASAAGTSAFPRGGAQRGVVGIIPGLGGFWRPFRGAGCPGAGCPARHRLIGHAGDVSLPVKLPCPSPLSPELCTQPELLSAARQHTHTRTAPTPAPQQLLPHLPCPLPPPEPPTNAGCYFGAGADGPQSVCG